MYSLESVAIWQHTDYPWTIDDFGFWARSLGIGWLGSFTTFVVKVGSQLPGSPRTDPSVRNSRTGLLKDTRLRTPDQLGLLFPSVRLACLSCPTCPAQVSFEGYVSLSAPSPCERRYRLPVLYGLIRLPKGLPSSSVWLGRRTCQPRSKMVSLRLASVSGFPLAWLNNRMAYISSVVPGANGASHVPDVSLHACHALMTPADPPESRPYRFLCIGFRAVNDVAPCTLLLRV